MTNTPPVPPLARNVGQEVLDWDHVEPARAPTVPRDVLGLSQDDRLALGMRPARTIDGPPAVGGDATAALAEALAQGAAIGKPPRRARR